MATVLDGRMEYGEERRRRRAELRKSSMLSPPARCVCPNPGARCDWPREPQARVHVTCSFGPAERGGGVGPGGGESAPLKARKFLTV